VVNLPVGITKLKSLACLDVSGCSLSFLPSQLWRLSALRHLRLNGTNLMVSSRMEDSVVRHQIGLATTC